ncbi:hypothetical protein H8L32_14640 [Undibacterium sp. CY18W]|uniref:Uncharacterized protein n=1 Tax=Undibacterium hunanense TaxID=2762292 RepID=A0ABR6ZSC9_9BURK|nr:hypothetical protein [Undibacterium hunanense]MBC3918729.1 hypothetical protein [Undibacterium hunanense]
MIISPISSVTTPGLQVTAARGPDTVSALSLTSGIGADSSLLDTARNSNITVDVSRLGELLAYVSKLQNRQTSDGVNRTDTIQTEADLAKLTAIASSFVDAFNQLQASNSSLSENPLVPTSSDSLLQAINAGAQNADGTSLFEQLGGIGINLQNASQPDSNSLLTLDVASFQNVLAKDSSGTIALLAQALQVLGSAESTVITQNQEFASGNILSNTDNNSIENTATTNAANNSNNINANSDPNTDTTGTTATATGNVNTVTPAANAEALLQQTLADKALQAEIETARNSQAAVNADVSNTVTVNTVDDAAQAIPGIPASPETRAAGLPASNDATNTAQINTPTNAALTISTNGTNGTNATNARIDTVPDSVANTGTGIDLNVASNAQAIDAAATGNTLSITADTADTADTANTANTTLPQSLNIQTPAQTSVQTPLQSPSTEIVDTSTAVQANTVTENRLAANVTTPVTTPSSLLTESQLENKIAVNSIQSNENAASTTASGNTKTAPNNYSALAAVSQTLDTTLATINQTSTAASNITASNQSPPASLASTTTASTVTSNTSTQQTMSASNSAAVNANINATDIPHIQDGINPLISAAVAAYRVRDGIQANTTEKPRPAQTDTVTATEAITVVEPVTLDLHEHAQNQRHDAEADSAYHEAEELGEPDKLAEVAGNINVNA